MGLWLFLLFAVFADALSFNSTNTTTVTVSKNYTSTVIGTVPASFEAYPNNGNNDGGSVVYVTATVVSTVYAPSTVVSTVYSPTTVYGACSNANVLGSNTTKTVVVNSNVYLSSSAASTLAYTNSTPSAVGGSSNSTVGSSNSTVGSSNSTVNASSSSSSIGTDGTGLPQKIVDKKKAYDFMDVFWQTFMNTNDTAEAMKINSTYFTENCKGRVSLTRDFEGQELNTEYIFGLFSNAFQVSFRMVGVAVNYTMNDFVFDNNVVSTSTTVEFLIPQVNFYIPVQIDMWLLLDSSSGIYRISEYDAVFRNFDRAYNVTNSYVISQLDKVKFLYPGKSSEDIYIQLAVESICEVHQSYCKGDNQQYSSYDSCVSFLKTRRLGEGYEGGRDTIFCRNLHQVMLPFRPAVHCPHIGPSGGDMCTDPDTEYNMVVDSYTEYFTTLFNDMTYDIIQA